MEREISDWHICQIPTRNVLQCDDTSSDIVMEEYEVTGTCYRIIYVLPVNNPIGPECISHTMLRSTMNTVCKFYNNYLKNLFPIRVIILFLKNGILLSHVIIDQFTCLAV